MYPGQQPGYAPPPLAAPPQRNVVGLIGLICAIVGFVFACVPGALIVGWVLLPIALILGIVGVFLSGKTKGTSIAAIIVSIVGFIVGAVVFFTIVGNAFSDAFHDSDLSPASSPSTGSQGSSTAQAAPPEGGSRDNPLPIGQPVSNEDWTVTLGQPVEAGDAVAAENQFNDPPKPGMEFWMVPVKATYTGKETGNPTFGIRVNFVGSDNRTYGDSCGVVPSPISDIGDLYAGGTAEGNVCVAVPAGADGLWSVKTGFIGDPVFFEAKP
ncbi:DUF308 domain-containing protein [Mycolicibacterium palauense]|uniref:DUF308 domain-containing protein n=1 Tax=Mycolicibacterium palauense TaxID=2034511 RepID=UPI001145AC86|nr:DUF308 domain-containing protein [Mycolicibacterium palauense]